MINSEISSKASSLMVIFSGAKTFFFPCGTFSRIASVATNRHMCKQLNDFNIFKLGYDSMVSYLELLCI